LLAVATQLFLQRGPLACRSPEDAVTVAVHREWDTAALQHRAQHTEVARGILLLAEGGGDDRTGGVVDGAHQRRPAARRPKPVVPRAVELQQHPRSRSSLAATAVTRRAVAVRADETRATQDPLQRGARDEDPLALGE
jgi:hypothetical protein